jgi:hypothetical protein
MGIVGGVTIRSNEAVHLKLFGILDPKIDGGTMAFGQRVAGSLESWI